MKKIRTVAMAVVVGLFLSMVAGNAYAAATYWPINGSVINAGVYQDRVYVVIKDQTQGNYWVGYATATLAKEILATALTAASGSLKVMGMLDPSISEWADMIIATE
jgi:hypothetical protein